MHSQNGLESAKFVRAFVRVFDLRKFPNLNCSGIRYLSFDETGKLRALREEPFTEDKKNPKDLK